MRTMLLILLFAMQTYASVDDFSSYINSASDNKLNMSSRWGALIQAAKFANLEQINQIRKFSSDKNWYMRNASLIALRKINPTAAMAEAKKLLMDKALVVRSAAVEIIATDLNAENKSLLAIEMSKVYNFNKSSSLWIRKQIVEKLSLSAEPTDRDFFIKSLFDTDKEIAQLSAETLSKITGEIVVGSGLVEKWQTIVKQKKWL